MTNIAFAAIGSMLVIVVCTDLAASLADWLKEEKVGPLVESAAWAAWLALAGLLVLQWALLLDLQGLLSS